MYLRGEVYYADLSPVIGSEQGGIRPVIIIQNNIGNKFSPTIIVAAITSKSGKSKLPTHIEVGENDFLVKDSIVLLEQIRTIDKSRIMQRIGMVDKKLMKKIDTALKVSVGTK